METAAKIIVRGDVQGVSYRYFAKKEAQKLGLSGYALNRHDGTVEIIIQGESNQVNEFLKWTKEGSPMASVEKVESKICEIDEGMEGFEVK